MYIIHRRHRIGIDPYAYNDESVTVLTDDRLRVRATPKLYLPNLDKEGALHPIDEGVSNGIDEVSAPTSPGDEVIVTYDEVKKIISIQDNGRGFPFNKLFDMCEVLNSSAKMGTDKRAYGTSGGVHGMGLKLINYFSKYMFIRTEREGRFMEIHYDDGLRKEVKQGKSKDHGTYIEWQIDDRFFTDTNITCDDVLKMLTIKSYVTTDATIIFNGKLKGGKEIVKEFKNNSLKDFMKQYNVSTPTVTFSDMFGGDTINVMFGYDAEMIDGQVLAAYTNNIFNKSGGSHADGVTEAITVFFREYLLQEYLSEKDKKDLKIKAEDCKTGLIGIISAYAQNPSFRGGQHKEYLDMQSIKNFAFRATRKALKAQDKPKLNKIAAVIWNNIKARMASEAGKKKVKKDITNVFSIDRIESYLPISKRSDGGYGELCIIEGKSAMGALKSVADRLTQALIAIRGKLDNIFDMTVEDALKQSTFLRNLLEIFGCGIGKSFDISKFPFDRVNIASDADTDGNEIACQIGMIFFKFFPEVIATGRLYRMVPPLYEVKQDGKSVFVPTNRMFLTLTQKNFVKGHTIYLNHKPLSKDDILSLLIANERYVETLGRIANQYAISPLLCEFLTVHKDIGFSNSMADKWSEELVKRFKFLKVGTGDEFISITGMIKSEFNLFEYVPDFYHDIEQVKVAHPFYGYSIDDLSKEDMSLYQTLKEFEKFQPKIVSRFKGLGEMDSDDLERTIMRRDVRHSVRLTMTDVRDTYNKLAVMHSRKPNYSKERKKFMANFKFDIMDIDT
jgi:DNA gyrase subunit B